MARFVIPGAESISGPSSLRPAGAVAPADLSGLTEGMQAFASGIDQLSTSAGRIGRTVRDKQNTADLARAEALWTEGSIGIGNEYGASLDFGGMKGMAEKKSLKLKQDAAAVIRDEEARDEWLGKAELRRLSLVDGAGDRAQQLSEANDRTNFGNALATSAKIIADPTIDEGTRQLARQQLEGTLQMGVETGLILPSEGTKFRRENLDAAEEDLAAGRAQLRMLTDPQDVMDGLAIPLGGNGGGLADAARLATGGAINITPELARLVAPALGDNALPQDDKLAAAYLKDPKLNAQYAGAVMDTLTDRFNGDTTAAVIASAPGGGLALAERWVKSGHNEGVLPGGVRDYYRKVMGNLTSESQINRVPVVSGNGVDLAKLDLGVVDRFENLQSAYGAPMPIIGSDASGSNIRVDISKLSEPERARLVGMASAMGFTGIGVDKDVLMLDNAEGRRTVGKAPGALKDAMAKHEAGGFTTIEPTMRAVSPEFAALPFPKRLELYKQAKSQLDQQAVDVKAGLAIVSENAPIAIAQSGSYNGVMPTVDDYVHAYGGAEGIERWKAFDASVQTAEATFDMRTMSGQDIASMVENAMPSQGGDMASVEQKKFDVISNAADATLKQRADDPAGYVIQNFPGVATAWEAARNDPSQLPNALTATAEAQQSLDMPLELLPKAQADAVGKLFNDLDAPSEQRIGAVQQVLFATQDPAQQAALFDQLVKSGVSRTTSAAFAATARGDTGAADRLFQAALFDPEKQKLPGKLPFTDQEINEAIQVAIYDENQIGDVTYGIVGGTAENFQRGTDDGTLFKNAVKLLLFGKGATSLDDAIRQVSRDMYGNVKVVAGQASAGGAGVKISLPQDEDERPYLDGFNALHSTVGDAMMANLTPLLTGVSTIDSMAAVMTQARDQRIAQILSEGYFAPAGSDVYNFVDPYTGQAVPDPNNQGQPLTFSKDEVLQAGRTAKAAQQKPIDMSAMQPMAGGGPTAYVDPVTGQVLQQ